MLFFFRVGGAIFVSARTKMLYFLHKTRVLCFFRVEVLLNTKNLNVMV